MADFGVAVDLPADRQRYEDVVYIYIKKKKKFRPLILFFYFYLKQIDIIRFVRLVMPFRFLNACVRKLAYIIEIR